MSALDRTLEIRTSPHALSGYSVDSIMFNVVLALAPTLAFAIWAFGLAAIATLTGALVSCLVAEWLTCRAVGQRSTLDDGSVAVTGLLYGLTLPPACPLWMVMLGGFVAVGLGKSLFGGLGQNPFNPALVGRACRKARPTSAGLKGFWPSPPKRDLPRPTATKPPSITIHSGHAGGRVSP